MEIREDVRQKADYVRDVILAANDGIVTTFAVVTGSLGASLSPSVVIILGFANLFADGISMATSSYLGIKSEIEYEQESGQKVKVGYKPLKDGIITFVSFVVAGLIPLISYVLNFNNKFLVSVIAVLLSLIVVGVFRGLITGKNVFRTVLENILIGGSATFISFYVGKIIDNLIS